MCGIIAVVGQYRYKEIPAALIERGPDAVGIYQDYFVQLIQTRLEITQCKVQLPFETDEYVLLFNGEIYNWKELAEDVGGKNEYESIIKAFKEYGEDVAEVLDGQFMIIIYNKKTKSISLIQDMFKIHTVYLMEHEESKIYSSNLRSLPQLILKGKQENGFGNITTSTVL